MFSTRKLVHISMLVFAFLLPFLSWPQAAGCALLALLFNVLILPRMGVDLGKRPGSAGDAAATERQPAANPWTGIVIYPMSVLLLILLYRHSLHVVGAVWAIMALGDGTAGVVGERLGGRALPYNREKTWAGFLAFVVAGTTGAYVLSRWIAPSVSAEKTLLVSTATAVVGALVESLPIRLDDNVSVPLVAGGFMFCAYLTSGAALASNLPYLGRRLLVAVAVNLVFAIVARGLRVVSASGVAAGLVLGVVVYLGYGWKSFLIMLAFVTLGSAATRAGYARKAARGIAERRGGARNWRQAAANSLAGAFFAALVITTRYEAAFLVAMVAAFAEAAGDTVSSEIGQWLGGRAYLITTLRAVPVGENGGVSLGGTVAGFAASAAVVALGYNLGLCGRSGVLAAEIALGAAFAGNLFDSVLGATIERRGLVSNGVVNFAGTSFAGGLALGLAMHW